MRASSFWRFDSRWLPVFAAILIVLCSVCEFSTDAHGAAPEQEKHHQDAGSHHHSAAHLTACEGAATTSSGVSEVGPDAGAPMPVLEAWGRPLQNHVGVLGRRPLSLSGPPRFILHAALLI